MESLPWTSDHHIGTDNLNWIEETGIDELNEPSKVGTIARLSYVVFVNEIASCTC